MVRRGGPRGLLLSRVHGQVYPFDNICCTRYGVGVWDVEFTDDFGTWWDTLGVDEQQGIDAAVRVLEQRGPGWWTRSPAPGTST